MRAVVTPVVNHLCRYGELSEASAHLRRMKKTYSSQQNAVLDVTELDDFFVATTLPVPDLDGTAFTMNIGPHTIEGIDEFKSGRQTGPAQFPVSSSRERPAVQSWDLGTFYRSSSMS